MKPQIFSIDIDLHDEDINITINTSEGIKSILLPGINKGCTICASAKGGLSKDHDGIFLTISGQQTIKI